MERRSRMLSSPSAAIGNHRSINRVSGMLPSTVETTNRAAEQVLGQERIASLRLLLDELLNSLGSERSHQEV